MTRNHNYATPNEGTIDWHVPLNRNFERIDTDAEIRDTEANIEDYEPKPDAKFLATDTGAVFIGDGSSWNEIGGIGGAEEPDGGDSIRYGDDDPLTLGTDDDLAIRYDSSDTAGEFSLDDSLYMVLEGYGAVRFLQNFRAVDGAQIKNGELNLTSAPLSLGGPLYDLVEYDNASADDLTEGEIALDTNAGGSGALGIVAKDSDGTFRAFTDQGGNENLSGSDLTLGHLSFTDEVVEIGSGASTSRETESDGTLRHGIAIGHNALASQLSSIAIGSEYEKQTKATADDAMAIGPDGAQATAGNAYAFGEDSLSSASGSIAFGKAAEASAIGTVAVGSNTDGVSNGARASADYSIAIGANASVPPGYKQRGIAIGKQSFVHEPDSIAIGAEAEASGDGIRAVAIGSGTTVETAGVARIGDGSSDDSPDQLVFTAEKDTIDDGNLNNGEMTAEMDEANDAFRLRGRDSEGTIREATIPW
jgi:hypothetical protein